MITWTPEQRDPRNLYIYDLMAELKIDDSDLCHMFENMNTFPQAVDRNIIQYLIKHSNNTDKDYLEMLLQSKQDWSPFSRPIKEFTRHLIARKVAGKNKKRLLVLPSTIGRDIQLFKYYRVNSENCEWMVVERNDRTLQQFKTLIRKGNELPVGNPYQFSIEDPRKIQYYPDHLHEINKKFVKKENAVDFAWFDFYGNINFNEVDFFINEFEINTNIDQDLFFTFGHDQSNTPGNMFPLLKDLSFNHELSFMRNAFDIDGGISNSLNRMIVPNKDLYVKEDRKYYRDSITKTSALDRTIFTHWNMLKYILSSKNVEAEIDCFYYREHASYLRDNCDFPSSVSPPDSGKKPMTMVIYHLKNFRSLAPAETIGADPRGGANAESGPYFLNDAITVTWNLQKLYTLGQSSKQMAENITTKPPSGIPFTASEITTWRKANLLPSAAEDYRFSRNFMSLLQGNETSLPQFSIELARQAFFGDKTITGYMTPIQHCFYTRVRSKDSEITAENRWWNFVRYAFLDEKDWELPTKAEVIKAAIRDFGRGTATPGFELTTRFLRDKNKVDGGNRKYRIIIDHSQQAGYTSYDPESLTFKITRHFLLKDNWDSGLFSVFRFLFKGDPYVHPQQIGSIGGLDPLHVQEETKYIRSSNLPYREDHRSEKDFLTDIRIGNRVKCLIPSEPQVLSSLSWRESFESGDSGGIIVLPTGMGKTNVAVDIIKYCLDHGLRIMFVAHINELLDQAVDRLVTQHPMSRAGKITILDKIGLIQASSAYVDPSQYRKRRGRLKTLISIKRKESSSKSDSQNRSSYYIDEIENPDRQILFAGAKVLSSLVGRVRTDIADVIIIDEFHHAAADTYEYILSYFRRKYLLGLTATPWRTDKEPVVDIVDNNILYQMQLHTAIYMGYLCYPIYRNFANLTTSMKEGRRDNIVERDNWKEHIFNIYMNEITTTKRTIAFCGSGDPEQAQPWPISLNAIEMAIAFDVYSDGNLNVRAITDRYGIFDPRISHDPTVGGSPGNLNARRELLDGLASGVIDIVFVYDILNEGIDVPNVDAIMLIRTTESVVKQFQQLGRGLRLAYDKKSTLIWDFEITDRLLRRFYETPYRVFMDERPADPDPGGSKDGGGGPRTTKTLDTEVGNYIIELQREHVQIETILTRLVNFYLKKLQQLGFGHAPYSEDQVISFVDRDVKKLNLSTDDMKYFTTARIKKAYNLIREANVKRFKKYEPIEILTAFYRYAVQNLVLDELLNPETDEYNDFWGRTKKAEEQRMTYIFNVLEDVGASEEDVSRVYKQIKGVGPRRLIAHAKVLLIK